MWQASGGRLKLLDCPPYLGRCLAGNDPRQASTPRHQ